MNAITFLLPKIYLLRLNVRLISAVYHNDLIAIYLSDHWKFLKITQFEIEFQSDFRKFVMYLSDY